MLDLARRIEHASSANQVEYVIGKLRQITQHLLGLEGVEGLTEEVRNSLVSLVTVSSKLKSCDRPARHLLYANVYFLLPELVKYSCILKAHLYCKIFFKSISICFRGTKYETFREHFAYLH